MITFEKFSILPVKVRTLFIKKLLNNLGYNIQETFKEDKEYKKALRDFQVKNNFAPNCVVSKDVYLFIIDKVHNYKEIYKELKMR